MPDDVFKPETVALHGGWRADPTTGSVAVPIHQTSSYLFHDTDHAENLFGLQELGFIYTRIGNPTNDVLEKRVAALEGGAAALAVASGQAASAYALQNIASAGDNIVSATDLYGGTWNLFANTLKSQGIEVRFVDPSDPENFRRATDERTRAYYLETLPNPKLVVPPIAEIAEIGREQGIPLIVDNTATPLIARPLQHGAAIVVYSATKYLGGHGNSIGGVIVDGGNFDWQKYPQRQPALNTPDPSYHGAIWTEAANRLGPSPISCVRERFCCATSAPRFRRSMHSSSCKALNPCRCALSGMSKTPAKSSNISGSGRRLRASFILRSSRAPSAPAPTNI